MRGLQRGLATLQIGRADEALVAQIFIALEVGCGLVEVGLCRDECSTCGVLSEPEILRVELRQNLSRLHDAARVDAASHELAADAKAESRFGAGSHLGRIFANPSGRVGRDRQGTHGAHRLRRHLGLRTGRNEHQGDEDERQEVAHEESLDGEPTITTD